MLRFRLESRALAVCRAVGRFATGELRRGLDLGAAEGLTILALARRFSDIESWIGVELSRELLSRTPELPASIRLFEGDVCDLPAEAVAEAPFDLVTALALLEHLPEPERAVTEAARYMAPGSLFVATCPSPTWDGVATRLGLLDDDQHASRMDRPGLARVVEKVGLELLHYERFMFAPVGFLPYLRLAPPPEWAAVVDHWLRAARIFDPLFVNQLVVARKV